jgi:hypothetical protein
MNIRHSKPVFTLLISAIALSMASFAGAAESGLSHNEQAAQRAIVDVSSTSIATAVNDAAIATLAQNETAAQHVIVVDYGTIPDPTVIGGDSVALVGNEHAAQRAIVDAPRGNPVIKAAIAITPVAIR